LTKRAKGNIDYIQGVIFPSQTYAFSGRQWGSSLEEISSKRPTDASPMIITSQPPGAFARDDSTWKLTFGTSHDSWLTLFNSAFMANTQPTLGTDAYGKALPISTDHNLFKTANDIQQISYVVNKNTVEEFRNNPKLTNEFAARGLGVRLPMMAAGWGKTVGLRPTDPQPTSDKRLNDNEHKLARETWKHGPVDIRWDSRRGMWSAFNDLITGNHKEEIGTLVFGTEPDENHGFPFLKGKIQDVWWVRKTQSYDGTIGSEDDFTQTAEVLTKLEHKWFDESTNAAAKLSSIFTIPGLNAGDCHPDILHTTQCGTETTHDAELVDLKTSVHFNFSSTKDGPLNFSTADIASQAFCNPADGFYHPCVIYFNDEGCAWDVAVKIDECELAGGHLVSLAINDIALAERMTTICNYVVGWAGGRNAVYPPGNEFSAPEIHDINFGAVNASILCLQSNIISAATATLRNAQSLDSAVYDASVIYTQFSVYYLKNTINTWITSSLIPVLQACCGEVAGTVATLTLELPDANSPGAVTTIPPEYLDCTPILSPMPRLNCEYCFGVHLNTPCAETPSAFGGDACFVNQPPVPTTKYGHCQAH
jgi:hypothetical protein